MARIRLSAFLAAQTKDGRGTQIDFCMAGSPPHPTEYVEIRTAADAQQALDDYADRAATYGRGMACFVALVGGQRAPSGFKKLVGHKYINLDREPRV